MGGRVRREVLIAAALALGGAAASPSGAAPRAAETLDVYAAASLADAFREIGARVERERPGLRVRFNFAGSNQLALQIEQGAPAAVFASADRAWMDRLIRAGRTAGPALAFARNRMVVVASLRHPERVTELMDLAKPRLKLVLAAEAVPAGRYARQVLGDLSRLPRFGPDFARRALANLVSEEDNVRAVVTKVEIGEADAGLCYRSDVTRAAARGLRVLEVPDSLGTPVEYPIAVLPGRHQETARAFVERVRSPEGQQILARHGFEPVAGP